MSTLSTRYHLQPADRVVIPKSNVPGIQHHGIYIGQDGYARNFFAHNKPGFGVHAAIDADFFSGVSTITRVEPFIGDHAQRNAAIARVTRRLGQPYQLIGYNCEHFSNEVQHGKVFSIQVRNALIAAICLLLIWLLILALK